MSEATVPLTTGFLLNGRYLVERELGRGGVGVVYLAHDEQLHARPVVIKILLEESYRNDWIKTKFRQEMEALSRLDHPGIVNLLNTGELTDGRPFLVMQYVDGVALRSILRPEGLELERASRLIRQIGDALTAAHERGVLHRDLKPENIMIQNLGIGEQVKIIDFGLAKVLNSRVAESTKIPSVAGSFSYMAPEQLMARPVSAASDLFSFGVIAYEMLTGRRPHNPDSMFQLLDMLRSGVRVRPRDLRPSLPEMVDAVILKSLAFEPQQRQSSAAQFAQELEHALTHPGALDPGATLTAHIAVEQAGPHRSRRIIAWISVVLLTASVLLAAKVSFFRFESWTVFLSRPQIFLPAAVWLVLAVLAPLRGLWTGGRAAALDRMFGGYGAWRILILLGISGAIAAGSASPPNIVRGQLVHGAPKTSDCCALSYSDPRGYRYTLQEDSYYSIRIMPDRFNSISDYELRVTLPPDLEFADIYTDRAFGVQQPLALEPSSTHDVLVLRRTGDSFRTPREILFTTKYRTQPGPSRVQVRLQTAGDSMLYEF